MSNSDDRPLRLLKFGSRADVANATDPSASPWLAREVKTIIDRLQVLALKHPSAAETCLDWLDRFLKSNGV